jgi:hypothetical protein
MTDGDVRRTRLTANCRSRVGRQTPKRRVCVKRTGPRAAMDVAVSHCREVSDRVEQVRREGHRQKTDRAAQRRGAQH